MMERDPYSLFVALDDNGESTGSLYVDDGVSFDYEGSSNSNNRDGHFVHRELIYKNKKLVSSRLGNNINEQYEGDVETWIERIVFMGIKEDITSVQSGDGRQIGFECEGTVCVVKMPGFLIRDDFELILT